MDKSNLQSLKKKVLVSWDVPQAGIDMMQAEGMEVTVWKGDQPLPKDQLVMMCKDQDALLSQSTDQLDADFFKMCGHLDVIGQFSVGYNNVDTKAASEAGIPFGNAPGAMTEATADVAFGLMVATSRKFFHMHKKILNGQWKVTNPQANLGFDLRGKTLGIFGLGRIGFEMARLCKTAYSMEIIYCNRTDNKIAEEVFDARRVTFDELLAQSDVLSIHCALTHETKGKFDKRAFFEMKESALLINTSRGAVVVQDDLAEAIEEGHIWGAGLDVTDPQPMDPNHKLLNMETVSVLPHTGSSTVTARRTMSIKAAENIIGFYKYGKVPYRVV